MVLPSRRVSVGGKSLALGAKQAWRSTKPARPANSIESQSDGNSVWRLAGQHGTPILDFDDYFSPGNSSTRKLHCFPRREREEKTPVVRGRSQKSRRINQTGFCRFAPGHPGGTRHGEKSWTEWKNLPRLAIPRRSAPAGPGGC